MLCLHNILNSPIKWPWIWLSSFLVGQVPALSGDISCPVLSVVLLEGRMLSGQSIVCVQYVNFQINLLLLNRKFQKKTIKTFRLANVYFEDLRKWFAPREHHIDFDWQDIRRLFKWMPPCRTHTCAVHTWNTFPVMDTWQKQTTWFWVLHLACCRTREQRYIHYFDSIFI